MGILSHSKHQMYQLVELAVFGLASMMMQALWLPSMMVHISDCHTMYYCLWSQVAKGAKDSLTEVIRSGDLIA